MTEIELLRRVCWMMQTCLTMPAWHPARVYRLPELADELALFVAARKVAERPN